MLDLIDSALWQLRGYRDELGKGLLSRFGVRIHMIRVFIKMLKEIRVKMMYIDHVAPGDECEYCTKRLLNKFNINFGLGKDN
jgi:hypothetical protein